MSVVFRTGNTRIYRVVVVVVVDVVTVAVVGVVANLDVWPR